MTKIEHNLAKDVSQEIETVIIEQNVTRSVRPNSSTNSRDPGDTPYS